MDCRNSRVSKKLFNLESQSVNGLKRACEPMVSDLWMVPSAYFEVPVRTEVFVF